MTQAYKLNPWSEPIGVPMELKTRKQWIGWRAVWTIKDRKTGATIRLDKPKKVPINIKTGGADGYDKPENHVTYDEAVAAIGRLGLDGVGFMLTPGCGVAGGDMDKCRNRETGVIDAWVQAIIDLKETYFEISPSGEGVRFWALIGDLPMVMLKKDEAGVELYSQGRYLTFTGEHVQGTPWDVRRAEETIRALMKRAAQFRPSKPSASAASSGPVGAAPGSFEDVANRKAYRESPMGQINQAALAKIPDWAPELFPQGEAQATGAWRVKAADLGRPFEEDISIHPDGIQDFAEREGKTAIDIVMDWLDVEPKLDATGAAQWLGVRVGVPFGAPGTGSGGGSSEPSPEDIKALDDWNAALARLRAASPRPAFVKGGSADGVFDPVYSGPAPLRPGVTDRLTRGFVASVSSAANAGKSTYLGAETIAIACERPDLLGLPEIDWCGDSMIVSNEESETTLVCRWRGQMKAHGLTAVDLKHRIRFWPTDRGRLRIGRGGKAKTVTPTPEGVGFVVRLAELAEAGQPAAFVGIDTLVSIFEGIDENSADMDKAMGLLIQVAEAGFIAVDVMQHQGKAADDRKETIHGYRGSSAIFAALAEMSTLVTLSAAEGREYGLDARDSGRTVRVMGQRQRDGRIPGTWYLRREIVSLPAEDPRAIGVLASREVAVLVPVVLTQVGGATDVQDAWRVLWGEGVAGRALRRGSPSGRGRRHSDQAAVVVEDALGWSPVRAGRVVDEIGRLGGFTVRKERDKNKNTVEFIDVTEPPKEAEPF